MPRVKSLPKRTVLPIVRRHVPKRFRLNNRPQPPASVLRKLPLYRWVKELIQQQKPEFHIQASALALLYEASDAYLISLFQDANLSTLHAKRRILLAKDLKLAERARATTH